VKFQAAVRLQATCRLRPFLRRHLHRGQKYQRRVRNLRQVKRSTERQKNSKRRANFIHFSVCIFIEVKSTNFEGSTVDKIRVQLRAAAGIQRCTHFDISQSASPFRSNTLIECTNCRKLKCRSDRQLVSQWRSYCNVGTIISIECTSVKGLNCSSEWQSVAERRAHFNHSPSPSRSRPPPRIVQPLTWQSTAPSDRKLPVARPFSPSVSPSRSKHERRMRNHEQVKLLLTRGSSLVATRTRRPFLPKRVRGDQKHRR